MSIIGNSLLRAPPGSAHSPHNGTHIDNPFVSEDSALDHPLQLQFPKKTKASCAGIQNFLALANGMIKIFTPSFADESDTNAQNLSVKEIVARMSPQKFQVIMLQEGGPDARIANRPNTRLIRCGQHGTTARILWNLLRDVPDIYFFPRAGPLDAAFMAARRRLRLKTAIVTYIVSGGLYNAEPPPPTMVRNVREADLVFANGRYLSQLVQDRIGVAAGVRYDGIDRRFFFSVDRRAAAGPLIVLFAGSLRPYKRVDLVVREAARWPNVKFRIVGKGEEEQKCRNLAGELGCSNVTFVGHLSSQGVGDEMRQADIFFFPSILEGHPQVLGQAAACGLPAIAMNVYHPEYVIEGKTGYLVQSDEDLGWKLDLLLGQPDLRLAMGEAAALHSHNFDWDRITMQWEEAFEEAAAKRRTL
jgi:glycosyltransferase involved in cell wall biosynthesis